MISVNGLVFFPLYWQHHDSWKWRIPNIDGTFLVKNHWGHQHLFLLGYSWERGNGDAFSGAMEFKFELEDIWGPRSGDVNQQNQYVVRGSPKWYFHVQEIWRRIYIQNWDLQDYPVGATNTVGRHGIKFDASQPAQTFGPFREGLKFSPYYLLNGGRTLPVEYYSSEGRDRHERENFIKEKYRAAGVVPAHQPFDDEYYTPPPNGSQPVKGTPGGYASFADGLYIRPIIEYQKVIQLDWERLPGYEASHDVDEVNDFGDGWSIETRIPFVDPQTSKYRSPFGPRPGVCDPPGSYYFDLVKPANQLKNRLALWAPGSESNPDGEYDYFNRPFGLPQADSLQPAAFTNPYLDRTDGRWVQQCLGGIVQAKALVTIESKLNQQGPAGYDHVWVHATQYMPQDPFAGTDQRQPPPTTP